jgi:protein TonB
LLLSGLLHGTLLLGLARVLLHAPQPLPALAIAITSSPCPDSLQGQGSRGSQPAAVAQHDAQPPCGNDCASHHTGAATGDLSQHPAATASPAATLSAAPGSTMTNTGEVNNAKPATSGASVHQPALYRSAYLHNPEPPYPERSRELGEQGRVILQVRVSAEGRALQVEVISHSRSRRLDEAARQAVADWRFIPARQDGVAIESSLQVPITFSLQAP